MPLLLPNLRNVLKTANGIKDAVTRAAVRNLEDWADQLTQRLARLEAGDVSSTRAINTTAPLTGGGDLSADRTLAITSYSGSTPGAVPAATGDGTNFLREDGTWADISATITSPYYGTGTDGVLTFDGVAAVTSSAFTTAMTLTPASNVYTLTRDIYASSITISSGVTVYTAGYRIFCTGTLTNNGTIHNNGTNAAGTVGGAGAGQGTLGGGGAGANGARGSGSGSTAASVTNCPPPPWTTSVSSSAGSPSGAGTATAGQDRFQGGGGGGGTNGVNGNAAGGNGGALTVVASPATFDIHNLLTGRTAASTSLLFYGSGGGAGACGVVGGTGSDPSSGGGGGGGGGVYVGAKAMAGTGTISANGGNGANGVKGDGNSFGAGGGGGGGGLVAIVYSTRSGTQTVSASGGSGGTGSGGGTHTASNGASGAAGWTIQFRLTGAAAGGGGAGLTDGDYGDITVSGLGTAMEIDAGAVGTAEIADNAVTLAKLQDATVASLLGAAAAGDPSYLTGAQATALLDAVSTSAKGLVPTAPNDATKYLDGTGAWSVPAGSGGGSGGSGGSFSGCLAYHSTTQNVASGVWTVIALDSESFDTGSFHSTASNTSRLVAPSTGYYLIHGAVAFPLNSSGYRTLQFRKNAAGNSASGTGLSYREYPTNGAGQAIPEINEIVYLTAGDYIELFAYQTSGSTLAVTVASDVPVSIVQLATTGTAPVGASVYNSAGVNAATATSTVVTFDTETFDNGGLHSTASNTSRLTASVAGYYYIHGSVAWFPNASGIRQVELRKNAAGSGSGGTQLGIVTHEPASGGAYAIQEVSTVAYLTAGDYVELFGYQTSGSTLSMNTATSLGLKMALLQGTVLAFSGASVHNNNVGASVANAASTALTYSTETIDTDGYHSTSSNTSRLTIPQTGYYQVTAAAEFGANGTGIRQVAIVKNGTSTLGAGRQQAVTSGGLNTLVECSRLLYLTAGDYLEAHVYQDSGGSLNVTTTEYQPFQITRLGA